MKTKRQDREAIAKMIKDIRTSARMLEAYFKMTKRQHRKLNLGHGCYDPVEYHTSNIMIRTASLRVVIEKGVQHRIELADGSVLLTQGGAGNSGGESAKIPAKYLTAGCNNPDSSLSPEELKIRYMPMGKCGR